MKSSESFCTLGLNCRMFEVVEGLHNQYLARILFYCGAHYKYITLGVWRCDVLCSSSVHS